MLTGLKVGWNGDEIDTTYRKNKRFSLNLRSTNKSHTVILMSAMRASQSLRIARSMVSVYSSFDSLPPQEEFFLDRKLIPLILLRPGKPSSEEWVLELYLSVSVQCNTYFTIEKHGLQSNTEFDYYCFLRYVP